MHCVGFNYLTLEITCSNCEGGNAPEILSTSDPFLKIANVGIERMLYCWLIAGFASVSSLTWSICSPYLAALAWKVGANILQGPHQGAQKSTMTGNLLWVRISFRLAWSASIAPKAKLDLQAPQIGFSFIRSSGSRLNFWQFGHLISITNPLCTLLESS